MRYCMFLTLLSLISLILVAGTALVEANDEDGVTKFTGSFISKEKIKSLRSNSIYLFGALGGVSLVALFARLYFKKYDTQS